MNDVVGRGTLLSGRYRVLQSLPSSLPGSSAWTASDQILDRAVHVTIVSAGNVSQALDAARRAALVADPRLVRILDVGEHEGMGYVVSEQVSGPSLAELVSAGPLPADQARALIGEAASALEIARRRGVHHLALRPSTLHVTASGGVVITGIAVDGVLLNLGNIAYEQQDHVQAEAFFRQSLALEQALGNRQRVSGALNNLALTAIAAQDYPKADALLNDALAIRRALTDHYGSTTILVGLGAIARLQGQPARARDLLREGLTLAQEVGDRHVTAIFLMEFGLLASAEGDPARAVPLLAASERLFQKLGGSPGSASAGEFRQALDAARAALAPATFAALWSEGQTIPPEQIVSRLLET